MKYEKVKVLHKIKSSLDAADMLLTRHMMQGLELPRNPLINILTRPRISSPVMLLFAVTGTHSPACKSSTIVPRAGFHPKIGMIWCWMMDERRILYFICSGLMRLRLWCRVSASCDPGECGDRVHAMLIWPSVPLCSSPGSISDHQRQRRRGRVFRVHTIKI